MFYHCVRPIAPNKLDPDQLKKVKAFFSDFEHDADHPGLYQSFRSTQEFVIRVRQDLMQFLLEYHKEQSKLESTLRPDLRDESSVFDSLEQHAVDIAEASHELKLNLPTSKWISVDLKNSKVTIAIVQLEGPFPAGKHAGGMVDCQAARRRQGPGTAGLRMDLPALE